MKKLFSSPRTTWAAIIGLVTLVSVNLNYVFDGDPLTNVNWETFFPELLALVGVIFARDNNKSSEDVGLKSAEPATPPASNA